MKFNLPYRSPETHCDHDHPDVNEPVLEAHGVTVQYSGLGHAALNQVSLRLMPGERGVLVGPNGAGKSTFLKTAAGLILPEHGSMTTFGCPARHCHPHTCYLPQRSAVNWDFPITVKRMVLTGSYVRCGWFRTPKNEDKFRAAKVLEHLKIDHLADRQIAQLSGGQQQRTLLARALLHDARLYLLDEPFNAVDRETLDIICQSLHDLAESGCTLLTSTHFLDTIPLEFDHSWALMDGHIQST